MIPHYSLAFQFFSLHYAASAEIAKGRHTAKKNAEGHTGFHRVFWGLQASLSWCKISKT